MKKEYSNGEVVVIWQPDKCIHSAKCFIGLPQVFDPKARPWVNAAGAGTEEIIRQVRICPSGALSYRMEASVTPVAEAPSAAAPATVIEILDRGPLLVSGSCILKRPDGTVEEINGSAALCRCGHSANKPFCDGSHRKTTVL